MKYTKQWIAVLTAVMLLALFGSCHRQASPVPVPPPTPLSITPAPTEPSNTLILVNAWNPIPETFGVELRQLDNGQTVAAECYDALTLMLTDCHAAGHHTDVCSGYRNIVLQTQLYENKVSRLTQDGYSRRDAERLAATEVASPGTSEHHTGLAVDIVDAANYNLDETQAQMPAQQWLMENCHRYGFILRYPKDKSNITGIIYEPWHYRYVGSDAAWVIHEQGLCLEEYLEK